MTEAELKEIQDSGIPIYGDMTYRFPKGMRKPKEDGDLVTFFNQLRDEGDPNAWAVSLHIKNEGKRNGKQVAVEKSKRSLNKGAADINIPGSPAFICEMKLEDCKASELQDGQIEYLKAAKANGAFVCFALGWENAWRAYLDWRQRHYENRVEA